MTTTKIMVAIGVLAVHLGSARWLYLRSGLAFAYLLPPILCCELAGWARFRARGRVRRSWSWFLIGGVSGGIAHTLIVCTLIGSPLLAPIFIVEPIDQLFFGPSAPRHTLGLENPIRRFVELTAIMFASGSFLPFFLASYDLTDARRRSGGTGAGSRRGDERPEP